MVSTPAAAQRIGSNEAPIYISSERAEATESRFEWSGNVRIVQGDAILTADHVVGELGDNGDISMVTATGAVRYADGEQAISGKRGVYIEAERKLTISDDVIVTQGKNVFTAGSAVYFIDSGKVRFTPNAGERVRGIFYTDSEIRLNEASGNGS